jgi:uncharacterized protein YjeT (DUF2065 family)
MPRSGPLLDSTLGPPGGPLNAWGWLLLAIGILLFVEGVVWVVSPQILLRLLLRERAASANSPLFRVFGATPMLVGAVALGWVLISSRGHLF